MDVLGHSEELLRRGAELRARSARLHAVAAGRMQKSRRLIAAAAEAKAVMHAHGWAAAAAPGGSSGRPGRLLAS